MEYYDASSYGQLVRSWGHEILVNEETNDYQGDTWLLLREGDRYGYLRFGWGSCSGCDALQSCYTEAEIETLSLDMQSRIRWESKEDMLKFMETHDWAGDYSTWSNPEEQNAFREKAIAILCES